MLLSLKPGVYKYWLYLFSSSHLQNNTCTSKQPPFVSTCLSCSPEMHRLLLPKPNPETLNRIKLLIQFRAPRRNLLFFSGLYSLPTRPCNKQTFNPTQVLSAHCLRGVYETIVTYLQLRMAFHDPRERDSMEITVQRSRGSREISTAHHGARAYQFPQWYIAVLPRVSHI